MRGTLEEINAFRKQETAKYREMLRGYNGFDLCEAPVTYAGLSAHYCDDRKKRCCDLVLLYAKFGLHRYNFLEGKDLQLSSVKRYNMTSGAVVFRSYYITLEANDPANDPATLQTFEVRVNEQSCNYLILKCSVARLRGETKKSITDTHFLYDDGSLMPELPPDNPFKDNTSRFYVLKESELQDNYHWIRLYLELVVATTNRPRCRDGAPINLKILKVAMESTPYLSQGFRAHDATFYIRYEDFCEAGKDVDRVAIVRRVLDEQSEFCGLVGCQHSSQTIIPSNMEAGSSSAQD